jgi:hypothetical protein
MIALIVSLLIGWLILRLLWPRAPIYSEPPAPQVVLHVHLIVPTERPAAPSSPSVGEEHWRGRGFAVD